jgi:hypothetical protein
MIPVIIQDYVDKILDKSTHPERRQFYYATLINIRESINQAIVKYEQERNFKK